MQNAAGRSRWHISDCLSVSGWLISGNMEKGGLACYINVKLMHDGNPQIGSALLPVSSSCSISSSPRGSFCNIRIKPSLNLKFLVVWSSSVVLKGGQVGDLLTHVTATTKKKTSPTPESWYASCLFAGYINKKLLCELPQLFVAATIQQKKVVGKENRKAKAGTWLMSL